MEKDQKPLEVGSKINISKFLKIKRSKSGLFLGRSSVKVGRSKVDFLFFVTEPFFDVYAAFDSEAAKIEGHDLYLQKGFETKIQKLLSKICGTPGTEVYLSEHGMQGSHFLHLETSGLFGAWCRQHLKGVRKFDPQAIAKYQEERQFREKILSDFGIEIKYREAIDRKKKIKLKVRGLRGLAKENGWMEKEVVGHASYAFTKKIDERKIFLEFSVSGGYPATLAEMRVGKMPKK